MTDKRPDPERQRARAISDIVSEPLLVAKVIGKSRQTFVVTTATHGGAVMKMTSENASLRPGDVFVYRGFRPAGFNRSMIDYVREATESERAEYDYRKNLAR